MPAAPVEAPRPSPVPKPASVGEPSKDGPPSGTIGDKRSDVYAEDWWSQAHPVFDVHGYYRLRAELLYKFGLGRFDDPGSELWPQPADNDYATPKTQQQVRLCGTDATPQNLGPCQNNTQAGANMRFRLNPELHISDNVRVLSQIDMLDNLVLGSTPEGYANKPTSGGYQVIGRGGYAPIGTFASTQWAPVAGSNSVSNSIAVKRVWGEYTTPVGVLRFGRMPSHWGLGMVANSGDGHDSDYASTADRLMFVTGYKKLDLYVAGMWDFVNEGALSSTLAEQQGQAHDLSQLDDVTQYGMVVVRKRDAQLQRLELARGQAVVNGGLYFLSRSQLLANDDTAVGKGAALGEQSSNVSQGFVRRGASAYISDLWLQVLYRKFRFEAEGAMILGSLENTTRTGGGSDYVNTKDASNNGWKIRQYGFTTQSEYRAVEDKLRLQFGAGYASGDPDVASLAPQGEGLQPQLTRDRTFSTFRFHPDYRVDLILFRNILSRVQGAYYVKPEVTYDFSRDKNGQRLGGGASLIWSRASEFVQTPGHARDLGVELDTQLYFQAKDGVLNDNPDKMGGFYTAIQYGVLFPLSGLGYMPQQVSDRSSLGLPTTTSAAQILRWYAGILF